MEPVDNNVERSEERQRMVQTHLARRGITNPRVLSAMREVPRHLFVDARESTNAYADRPLRIECDQTISQPYVVALMTQLLRLTPNHRVLDIGTGSGYQAAILSQLVPEVWSIEIHQDLFLRAQSNLKTAGIQNVRCRWGDGALGLEEAAPFDAILVAAAPRSVPPALLEQLAPGGRLVIPVGDRKQQLMLFIKGDDGQIDSEVIIPVSFVPMTGTWAPEA